MCFLKSLAPSMSVTYSKPTLDKVKRRHVHTPLDHPIYDQIRIQLGSKYAVAKYMSKRKRRVCERRLLLVGANPTLPTLNKTETKKSSSLSKGPEKRGGGNRNVLAKTLVLLLYCHYCHGLHSFDFQHDISSLFLGISIEVFLVCCIQADDRGLKACI